MKNSNLGNKKADRYGNKGVYVLLLIIGLMPFIIPVVWGIIRAINGDTAGLLCISDCKIEYGFPVFMDFLLFYSIVYWPTYIVGLILIFFASSRLGKIKKQNITKK